MSPIAATTPASMKGIKGKRVIGKPGRFDPDRPFHMSTRKGGNKTSSASAPSANGSAEGFESRRASVDAERPVTANSNGTQASKGTYASDFSPPRPVPDIDMTEAPLEVPTVGPDDDERKSRSPTPAKQATPSRKRKRSSPSPPPAPPSDDVYLEVAGEDDIAPPEDDYDSDTVQVIRQEDLSDREKSVNGDVNADEEADESPNSTPSQEPSLIYNPLTGKWADASPIISEQPSPATSGSGDEENQYEDTTIVKPLTAALKEVRAEQVEPVTAEQAEDEPMVDAAPGIDDADEIEEQVRTDEDGRMMVRRGRFGGRRRAQHPNIDIEVAMRRQAQLKSAYRTLARAQKNILIELATRTIDDLESNPNSHTEAAEYESIMRGLDASLAKRKATIQAQHDMKLRQLKVTRDGEQDAIVDKCRQQLEDMEEAKVDQLQYEFLRIARAAQLENEDETEDEDDFIPRPKHTAYHWKRGAGLGKEFDSRSRLAIETRQAAEDMQARYNMHEILKELPKVDKPQKRDAFAVMDERPRTAASKNREGQDNLDMLVAAGNEAEKIASAVIPNEQAVGLQMLADLSVRPSILGPRPQSSDSASGPGVGRNLPPGLHLQVPPGHSPIQLQMSPRTQHAMGNRFDSSHMPPPSTPRQDANAPGGRSPGFRKHERRPSSPTKQEQRPNGLQGHTFKEPMRSPAQPTRLNQAEMLQQRIASRDGALQDSLFGSSARNTRPFPDFPGWRPIDAPEGPRRRAASHSDLAPLFGGRPDPPLEHRREEPGREPERPTVRAEFKNESPKFDPVHAQGLRWPDQFHSSAGAPKGRKDETASPKSEQLSMIGTPGHKYSSSSGQDSAAGNKTSLENSKNSNFGKFSHKTNKAERNGASRRQKHKDKKKQNQQQEDGRSESAGTPGTAPAQYAGSPASDMRAQSPWFPGPPPMHSPRDYHPPAHFPHHHSGSYGGPPPPHNLPPHHPPGAPMHHHRSSYDYGFHHRNSFPPAPPPPWHGGGGPPPPSSLYALPHQQQQHPPPPGVPPEQYNRPFAPPPPPPGFQGSPQTPHPHSAGPGSGFPNANNNNHQNNNNFRGPAIAPAGSFNPGGFRPANPPLPAFAQQQQQNGGAGSGGGGGSRRRTQSDASFAKFLPLWKPKDGG